MNKNKQEYSMKSKNQILMIILKKIKNPKWIQNRMMMMMKMMEYRIKKHKEKFQKKFLKETDNNYLKTLRKNKLKKIKLKTTKKK